MKQDNLLLPKHRKGFPPSCQDQIQSCCNYIQLIKSGVSKGRALNQVKLDRYDPISPNSKANYHERVQKRASSWKNINELGYDIEKQNLLLERQPSITLGYKNSHSQLSSIRPILKSLDCKESKNEAAVLKKYDQYAQQTEKKFKERVDIINNYLRLDDFQPLSIEQQTRHEFLGKIRQNCHNVAKLRKGKYIELGGTKMTEVVSLLEQDLKVEKIFQQRIEEAHNEISHNDGWKKLERSSFDAILVNPKSKDTTDGLPLTQLLGSFEKNFPNVETAKISFLQGFQPQRKLMIGNKPRRSTLQIDLKNQSEFLSNILVESELKIGSKKAIQATAQQQNLSEILMHKNVKQEIAIEFNQSQYLRSTKESVHHRFATSQKTPPTSPHRQGSIVIIESNRSKDDVNQADPRELNFEDRLDSFKRCMINRINPSTSQGPPPLVHTDSLKNIKEKFNILKDKECERMGLISRNVTFQRKIKKPVKQNSVFLTQIQTESPQRQIPKNSTFDKSHLGELI